MSRSTVKLTWPHLWPVLIMALVLDDGLGVLGLQFDTDSTRPGNQNSSTNGDISRPKSNQPSQAGALELQPAPAPRLTKANESDLNSARHPARSKPIYFDQSDTENSVPTSIKLGSKLAIQLVIADKRRNAGLGSTLKPRTKPSSLQLHRKRPYDIVGTVSGNVVGKYHASPADKLFYTLDKQTPDPGPSKLEWLPHGLHPGSMSGQDSTMSKPNLVKKSELIRTQHRPPSNWSLSTLNKPPESFLSPNKREEIIKGLQLRFKSRMTTVPPDMSTTEFFKLISSAHSPVNVTLIEDNKSPALLRTKLSQKAAKPTRAASHFDDDEQQVRTTSTTTTSSTTTSTTTTTAPVLSAYAVGDTNRLLVPSSFQVHPSGESDSSSSARNQSSDLKDFISSAAIHFDQNPGDVNLKSGLFNHAEMPTVMFDGKKQVTLIRHVTRRPGAGSALAGRPTAPPAVLISSHHNHLRPGDLDSIEVPQHISLPAAPEHLSLAAAPPPSPPPTTASPLVRLISKHKHKYDDNIISPTLTVVDNHAIRVPPNATSVHNNKLIVAIRPGRPMRPLPPTTQFPVYNIVAGITPPYISTPLPHLSRPVTVDGGSYGLLRPNTSSTQTTPAPSSFGVQNIKFPAPSPSNIFVEHAEYPTRFNLSVPDSAHPVGPHGVPDKITVNAGEQHLRPPEAIAISDATIVSRPAGSITITSDGVEKLSTTRKPARLSTTKRINIVSANTTVITTNPEELHEMLNGVIAGSHTQHNITTNNKPTPRPGFLAYISSIFTNSFTTTLIAALTIVKTILVAILVMFLPPLALASAIMQAVSLG